MILKNRFIFCLMYSLVFYSILSNLFCTSTEVFRGTSIHKSKRKNIISSNNYECNSNFEELVDEFIDETFNSFFLFNKVFSIFLLCDEHHNKNVSKEVLSYFSSIISMIESLHNNLSEFSKEKIKYRLKYVLDKNEYLNNILSQRATPILIGNKGIFEKNTFCKERSKRGVKKVSLRIARENFIKECISTLSFFKDIFSFLFKTDLCVSKRDQEAVLNNFYGLLCEVSYFREQPLEYNREVIENKIDMMRVCKKKIKDIVKEV